MEDRKIDSLSELWSGEKSKQLINAPTLSRSNGIDSELECSTTSVFTKKKMSPLEQTTKIQSNAMMAITYLR